MYLVSAFVAVLGATASWSTMDHVSDQTTQETPHIDLEEEEDSLSSSCHTLPNLQTSTDSRFRLETKYERDEASEMTLLILRAPASCRHLSTDITLYLTLQTNLLDCTTQVNVSYIGRTLHTTLTGAWSSDPLVQANVEGLSSGPKHTLPHRNPLYLLFIFKTHQINENLRVMWDGVAKSVILIVPKFYLILSSGVVSKSSEPDTDGDDAQSWQLCVQGWDNSAGGHASNSPHKCQATRTKGHEVVEVIARRHSVTVGHHTEIMKFCVDIQMGDNLHHLLNFTFHNTSHHKESQQFILQFPVLQLILEADVTTKRNQINQYINITAEMRNLATEARVKFLSWEVTNLHNAEAEVSYCDSKKDVTGDTKSSNEEYVSEHCPYTPVSGTSTKTKPVSENRVKDIRQMVISDVFNLKSNMTVHASPAGQHIIRIHQGAYIPFCPLLDWSLNQIFNFSKDFSGWEYVVSQWVWGNMVVQGEWGISPLQWYQKIFSFSLDQAAPLPSTHLILDFRNSSKFHVLVRWPTLACALSASVSIDHTHHTLQVKELDEFKVESDRVLLEIAAKKNHAGMAFSWTYNAERITHLYTVATTLLTQAASHPWMCGDSQNHHPIRQFLENLIGKDLDHLHATIIQQGWNVLQWFRHNLELDLLWEAAREELATSEAQPLPTHGSEKPSQATVWRYMRAAAERLGVLRDNPEGEGILIVTERLLEWSWLVQRLWKLLKMENNGNCPLSCQLSLIIEDLTSQLKHLMLNE